MILEVTLEEWRTLCKAAEGPRRVLPDSVLNVFRKGK